MATEYTGPGSWILRKYSIGGELTSIEYSQLGGGKVYADYQIGDHLFARVSISYCFREHHGTSGLNTDNPTPWGPSVYFSFSTTMWDIEEIHGYGNMYNRSDIQPATFSITLFGNEYTQTVNWNIGRNTKDIIIPDGATNIGNEVFRGLNNSSQRFVETRGIYNDEGVIGRLQTYSESGRSGAILETNGFLDTESFDSFPAVTIGSSVKSIGRYAFNRNLTSQTGSFIGSVTVKSNSVGTIGESAFSYQRRIAGIDFHEGPVAIGANAFQECNSLEYVNFNDNWAYTGNYGGGSLFDNCYVLERISPKNVIKNVSGNMYRNCNYLTKITIHEDEFVHYSRLNALYVDLFAGNPECLDEEGYLITEINDNSVIDPEVLAFNWKDNWHRIIAYYTDVSLHLYHNGHHIEISLYSGGIVPLKHKDIWFYLKTIELVNNTPRHNQTPLFIAHQGKWLQVCW